MPRGKDKKPRKRRANAGKCRTGKSILAPVAEAKFLANLTLLPTYTRTSTPDEWRRELGQEWGLLCDEIEFLRAEVERLTALVNAATSGGTAEMERAAIVAWLRGGTHGYLNTMDITSRIERGGHHESADK